MLIPVLGPLLNRKNMCDQNRNLPQSDRDLRTSGETPIGKLDIPLIF